MPRFSWDGDEVHESVTIGGLLFEPDVVVDVPTGHLVWVLERNAEFTYHGAGATVVAPTFAPPGPTAAGTGPGSGPYQTTGEVLSYGANLPPPPEEP
jgi:hypothetical protein